MTAAQRTPRKRATPAERIAYAKVVVALGAVEVTHRCNSHDALLADVAKLRAALDGFLRSMPDPETLQCGNFHHHSNDYHGGSSDCGPLHKAIRARDTARAALQSTAGGGL